MFLLLLFIQYLHGPNLVSSELLRKLALKTQGTVKCKPMNIRYKNQEIWYFFVVAQSCPTLFSTPRTVTRQAPLSMGFFRQEYWSGLPFPPPGDLSDAAIEAVSLVSPALAGGFFTTVPPGKPE